MGLPDGEKWHTMNSEIIIVSVRLAIIYILQVQNLVGLGLANWPSGCLTNRSRRHDYVIPAAGGVL